MSGETAVCTRVNTKRTRSMALEFTSTLTEASLRDNGRMVSKMASDTSLTRLVKTEGRENGLREFMLNGLNDAKLSCSIIFNRQA